MQSIGRKMFILSQPYWCLKTKKLILKPKHKLQRLGFAQYPFLRMNFSCCSLELKEYLGSEMMITEVVEEAFEDFVFKFNTVYSSTFVVYYKN